MHYRRLVEFSQLIGSKEWTMKHVQFQSNWKRRYKNTEFDTKNSNNIQDYAVSWRVLLYSRKQLWSLNILQFYPYRRMSYLFFHIFRSTFGFEWEHRLFQLWPTIHLSPSYQFLKAVWLKLHKRKQCIFNASHYSCVCHLIVHASCISSLLHAGCNKN